MQSTKTVKKPELLAPAGNTEAFYAAMEAGADAVYVGLREFNARERATNFTYEQLPVLLEEAHKRQAKVFVTLNTTIKNSELPKLIETLTFLDEIRPDALIIQDWGLYFLLKKYFRKLNIHASTQMANHNSLATQYAHTKRIKRVILARELTFSELETVRHQSHCQLEVFVHGALCYSLSGLCHFSSFLGGHGANRGLCTQPCRRLFSLGDKKEDHFFSLKDNQQIEQIPQLAELGINSLKIEGRLKSDEYVFRVVSAYRKALDDHNRMAEAKEELALDLARDKTSYFLGKNLKEAITHAPNTGILLGKILQSKPADEAFVLESPEIEILSGFRLRVKNSKNGKQTNIKVKELEKQGTNYKIFTEENFPKGSEVFLSGMRQRKFHDKLPRLEKIEPQTDRQRTSYIMREISTQNDLKVRFQLFVRIDSLQWLRKVNFPNTDNLILSFTKDDFENLRLKSGLVAKYKHKIWFELPQFIAENDIEFYQNFAELLVQAGFRKFFLSHISQKLLLPPGAEFATNENVYATNDSAISFFLSEGARFVTYPVENDSQNLYAYKFTQGIVPLYFHPKLFVSRMPTKIPSETPFTDDTGTSYKKSVRNGITFVYPEQPVSLLHLAQEFKAKHFKRFLIDFSFEKPSSNRFDNILKRYLDAKQIQPSSVFNFTKGLK